MKVKLLKSTNLSLAAFAGRLCWDSMDKFDSEGGKIGENDFDFLNKLLNIHHHESVFEHIVFTFYIEGISRAVLQELARHRIASYSVESTRHTLKKFLNNPKLLKETHNLRNKRLNYLKDLFDDVLVFTNNNYVDWMICQSFINVIECYLLDKNIKNDVLKYLLPEAYKTKLVMTINLRSLLNFLRLRKSKAALWEIRELANKIEGILPDSVKNLIGG